MTVIPYESEDDERWVRFAGQKLADRFGRAQAGLGIAGWQDETGAEDIGPVYLVGSLTPTLTDLDLTILFGVALQVYVGLGRRPGVAAVIDDDVIMV